MATILFPSSSSPGLRPQEGAGRLVNAYAEKLQDGAPAPYVIRRAPGLVEFASATTADGSPVTNDGYRGSMFDGTTYIYAALEDTLVKATEAGVVTTVGTLNGSMPVFFARNNKTPTPDKVVVTEDAAYTFTDASVTVINDADLPQPNSVCFLDGYFFFTIADGRCFASGINDVTIAGTDYYRAEARPDGLTRGVAFGRELYLFGPTTCEVMTDTAQPAGFPFSRVAVIPRGLLSARAVAGWEDDFATALIWVAQDNKCHRLNGYSSDPISPPEVDRLIEATADKTTIEACVYVIGGHPCWVVSGPDWSWVYDLISLGWHERRSYMADRWRLTGNTVSAFGKWLGGDTDSGRLVEITEAAFDELGDPLVWDVESYAMEAFPARLQVPTVRFDMVGGVGIAGGEDPIERDPQVEILWSDDGGNHWSTPLLRDLGRQMTFPEIRANRLGLTGRMGRRWRLRVSDPVYVGLFKGDMQVAKRS